MSLARAIRQPSIAFGAGHQPAQVLAQAPGAPLAGPSPVPTAEDVEFWDFRYRTNRTPWDPGRTPAGVLQWIERTPPKRRHVLIPGCGRGHEIFSFSGAGWNTTAIDLSPAAIEKVKRRANRALAKQIHCGDFFAHPFSPPAFDLIYERTFLSSLPPARWPEFVARVSALLKPGGLFLGYFYFGSKQAEPPFGLGSDEHTRLLEPRFTLVEDAPVVDSLPVFDGSERWMVWQKR